MALTITTILCMAMLAVTSYTDIRYRKVPNLITFPAMITGIILCAIYFRGELPFRLAMTAFFFFFGMLGWMGLGDIKLVMAIICLRGVNAGLLSLLLGEMLLLIYCLVTNTRAMVETLKDTVKMFLYRTKILKYSDREYPAAAFIAAGYVLFLLLEHIAPSFVNGGLFYG